MVFFWVVCVCVIPFLIMTVSSFAEWNTVYNRQKEGKKTISHPLRMNHYTQCSQIKLMF